MFSSYNLAGYGVVIFMLLMAAFVAPLNGDPLTGLLAGFAYYFVVWAIMGVFMSDICHMALAHNAVDFKPWFLNTIAILSSTFTVYVNPKTWTNRHRLHHVYSDKDGDPNKVSEDGFFKTVWLAFFPYKEIQDLTPDPIFKKWPLNIISTPYFAVFSQFASFGLAWLIFRDWKFALVLWGSFRVLALYINLLQNYWAHEKKYGSRRYADDDNAMNLTNFLPVTLTLSACLQNNHHHSPRLLRLSHDDSEYDFGFITIKMFTKMKIAKPTEGGLEIPSDVNLVKVGISGQ
ncbi:MAG: fatty acid desaturase [Spirochaetota bacterium]|nr:fatty acid desaturase [Spirochaetota bacterium]